MAEPADDDKIAEALRRIPDKPFDELTPGEWWAYDDFLYLLGIRARSGRGVGRLIA